MLRRKSIFAAVTVAALLVVATGGTALSSSDTTSRAASAAAATPGCGKTPTLRSGAQSIQSSGQTRSFILRIPDNYDNNHPYRLIFGFHWLNGTAVDVATGQTVLRDVWAYYGLLRLSNNSTIFVAPQGLNNGWANSGGQDMTFVDDILGRRHHATLLHRLQLWRRYELRTRVCAAGRLPHRRSRGRVNRRRRHRHLDTGRGMGLHHAVRDHPVTGAIA
jgi:hypothetical protein